jgi:hypothetical protein
VLIVCLAIRHNEARFQTSSLVMKINVLYVSRAYTFTNALLRVFPC